MRKGGSRPEGLAAATLPLLIPKVLHFPGLAGGLVWASVLLGTAGPQPPELGRETCLAGVCRCGVWPDNGASLTQSQAHIIPGQL